MLQFLAGLTKEQKLHGENGLSACACDGYNILSLIDKELDNIRLEEPEDSALASELTIFEVGSGGLLCTSKTIRHACYELPFENIRVVLSERNFDKKQSGTYHIRDSRPPSDASVRLALNSLVKIPTSASEDYVYFTPETDSFAKFTSSPEYSTNLSMLLKNSQKYAEKTNKKIDIRLTGDLIRGRNYDHVTQLLGQPSQSPLLFFTSHINPWLTLRFERFLEQTYPNFHSFHVDDKFGRISRDVLKSFLKSAKK